MLREILDWTETKREALEEVNFKNCVKAFGLGAIEGALEGAVIGYPFLLVAYIITDKKLRKSDIWQKLG